LDSLFSKKFRVTPTTTQGSHNSSFCLIAWYLYFLLFRYAFTISHLFAYQSRLSRSAFQTRKYPSSQQFEPNTVIFKRIVAFQSTVKSIKSHHRKYGGWTHT